MIVFPKSAVSNTSGIVHLLVLICGVFVGRLSLASVSTYCVVVSFVSGVGPFFLPGMSPRRWFRALAS